MFSTLKTDRAGAGKTSYSFLLSILAALSIAVYFVLVKLVLISEVPVFPVTIYCTLGAGVLLLLCLAMGWPREFRLWARVLVSRRNAGLILLDGNCDLAYFSGGIGSSQSEAGSGAAPIKGMKYGAI